MRRRFAQVSLALFLVLAIAGMASAAVVGSVNKGSLLVFPKVIQWDGDAAVTTYIYLANDQVQQTYVKCYWMNEKQEIEDFHFLITANQPIVFSTDENDYGPPFDDNMSGSLMCWAQDAADRTPIQWNHLYGYALISSAEGEVFYNAYAFRRTAVADVAGQLNLNNVVYDACPKYLITTFIPDDGVMGISNTSVYPSLTLWPCKQDLKQDRTPTRTKAKFDIWNWNEVKFTGAYKCIKCFFEGYLAKINTQGSSGSGAGYGEEKFTSETLSSYGPDVARLRIQGVGSTAAVCKYPDGGAALFSPLLGVMLYGDDPLYETPIEPVAGYGLYGAGTDLSGQILFDQGEVVEEVVKQ